MAEIATLREYPAHESLSEASMTCFDLGTTALGREVFDNMSSGGSAAEPHLMPGIGVNPLYAGKPAPEDGRTFLPY